MSLRVFLEDVATEAARGSPINIEFGLQIDEGFEGIETNAGGIVLWSDVAMSEIPTEFCEVDATPEQKLWIDNYNEYSAIQINARVSICGLSSVSYKSNEASGFDWLGSSISVGTAYIASSGNFVSAAQLPDSGFCVSAAVGEIQDVIQEGQLTRDKCEQVLIAFTNYAEEILKRKSIVITETKIRDWQAIDDKSWSQCILEITLKAKSYIALKIWDELGEELRQFIKMQPNNIRPFLEEMLSLSIKWI